MARRLDVSGGQAETVWNIFPGDCEQGSRDIAAIAPANLGSMARRQRLSPKTKAFSSLTLYDKDFYLPKGLVPPRHVLNSNSGMVFGADGALDILSKSKAPVSSTRPIGSPRLRVSSFC